MDAYLIGLRIVHLLAGVYWVGASLFFHFFLEPATAKTGPAGGQVMGALTNSKMPVAFMSSSTLAVLSGFLLYWRDSAGFNINWITSGTGLAFSIGGIAGLISYVEGVAVQLPIALKLKALGQQIQAGGGAPSPEQMEESHVLQKKMRHASTWTVIFLVIAVIGMAVARYIY